MSEAGSDNGGRARASVAADERPRRRLGAALRQLRRDRGLSLTAAAEASGLSRSFIAMVESGSTEIAVSRLIRLAGAYGAFAADLLTEIHSTAEPEVVRSGETYEAPTSPPSVTIEYLASASWTIQPFIVSILPGGRLAGLCHAGTEFVHCVEGEMRMSVGDEKFDLAPGDTLVIPEHVEHAYANEGDGQARVVGGVERPASSDAARPHG